MAEETKVTDYADRLVTLLLVLLATAAFTISLGSPVPPARAEVPADQGKPVPVSDTCAGVVVQGDRLSVEFAMAAASWEGNLMADARWRLDNRASRLGC